MEIIKYEKTFDRIYYSKLRSATRRVIVHHSAYLAEKTTIDLIEKWHLEARVCPTKRARPHIGYHYCIPRDGRVFQTLPEMIRGIHTLGHNHDSLSVCVFGNFEFETPTNEQINSLTDLFEMKANQYSLMYWQLYGHGSQRLFSIIPTTFTSCPGKGLESALQGIRRKVMVKLHQDIARRITVIGG